MKLQITHLKAPWPEGSQVGDVIEMDAIPPWALGKCVQAPDDARATPPRKPAKADADKAPTPPVAQEQQEAETPEQRAQREREEADAAKTADEIASRRAAVDADAEKAPKGGKGKG